MPLVLSKCGRFRVEEPMQEFPIKDTEKVTILGGPETFTGNLPTVPGPVPFNFGVENANPELVDIVLAPDFQPNFDVIPKIAPFFGADRVATLTLKGNKYSGGPLVVTPISVRISGSLPDDGT